MAHVLHYPPCVSADRPWTVTWDSCVLSGDRDGAPLAVSGGDEGGPCTSSKAGYLDLVGRAILSIPAGAFDGLLAVT